MSARNLIIMAVVVVLLGGGLWLQRTMQETGRTADWQTGDPLFPGLDINAVRHIVIEQPDGKVIVSRPSEEDIWRVESLYGYPADFPALAGFLRKVKELEVGQVVRGGEDFRAELGLAPAAGEERAPTVLTLETADGLRLASLEAGSARTKSMPDRPGGGYPDGRYVQAGHGPVVLIAEQLSRLDADPAGWIQRQLLEVSASAIQRVSVQGPQTNCTITVLGRGQYELDPPPAAEREIDTSRAGRLARALQYLRCATVADPGRQAESMGLDEPRRLTFVTDRGFTYELSLGQPPEDEACYARLSVSYEPPPGPTRENVIAALPDPKTGGEAQEPDTADSREARVEETLLQQQEQYEARVQQARTELEKLQERFAGWTYVLDSHACQSLYVSCQDLVQEPAPEETRRPEAGGSPQP